LLQQSPLPRDAVAFSFWPDLPETEARAKLRSHLHYVVHGGLPSGDVPWILADKRVVQWNPKAPVWVDVAQFERLASDPKTAAEAIDLYRGDLLLGFDDEWLETPRIRLRERAVQLLIDIAQSARDASDLEGAAALALRALEIDPWREEVLRFLIAAQAQSGHRAQAVRTYREFAQKLNDEFAVEPMPETRAAYEAISPGNVPQLPDAPATRVPQSNLPEYVTSFVDRDREIAMVRSALDSRRLVTVTGAGGVGKTRLAIEAARRLNDRFPDGICLVELGALQQDELIVPAIAEAAGVVGQSEESLLQALRHRHMLLILDNCEHLRGVSVVVQRIVTQCAGVCILATSREPLSVTGERIERLSSLPTGIGDYDGPLPSIDELHNSPAVRLFLDRAADVSPELALPISKEDDVRALATISHRLDGIPLAIELAAARTSSLSLDALAERLDDRFSVLSGRSTLPRHQTLRATLDWSYALLAPEDQRVFARLGIFAGGWTVEAAAAVCADILRGRWEMQDRLGSLIDKSLVLRDRSGDRPRYRLLETMRAYALERLEDAGEKSEMARRHARFFGELGREHPSFGIRDSAWFLLLRPELQNMRAALAWSIDKNRDPVTGSYVAESFAWYAYQPSLGAEAIEWCKKILIALGPHAPLERQAAMYLACSACYRFLKEGEHIVDCGRRAVALYRELGDKARTAHAIGVLLEGLRVEGASVEARALADEALSLAREAGDSKPIGRILMMKATLMRAEQQAEREAILHEAVDTFRSVGDTHGVFSALVYLGETAFQAGRNEAALAYAQACIDVIDPASETLSLPSTVVRNNAAAYAIALGKYTEAAESLQSSLWSAYRMGDPVTFGYALQYAAAIALAHRDSPQAARLIGASDGRLKPHPSARDSFTERSSYESINAQLRSDLAADEVESLMKDGRRWTNDEALSQALHSLGQGSAL
jgi:predicted ATPase/DNA-binding SARP family transcriptional activator